MSRVAGAAVGAAAAAARLSGAELVMASCEELVQCLRLRLGPAVKVYFFHRIFMLVQNKRGLVATLKFCVCGSELLCIVH